MTRISVIMPVYNTKEEYLREAIESILNQTYKDFEFIIVDDGSTTDIKSIVQSYQDPRIKYHYQENTGIAGALNKGLSLANSEYIARMDSDDISLPERFEKQVNFLDTHPEISVLGSWFEQFPTSIIIKHKASPKYLDFYKYCHIGHPTVMFRKKNFDKYDLKYNPKYLCEDYELWSRAIRYVKFANLQEVLLKYRWHDSNLSIPKPEFLESVKKVQQNMLEYLSNDTNIQNAIKEIFFPTKIERKEPTVLEKIFSVKNEYTKQKTYKVITLAGIKIKFSKKEKKTKYRYKLLFLKHLLPQKIKNQKLVMKTNNTDKNILDEISSLESFYFMPNSGNMGDILIATSEFQYFDSKKLQYKIFDRDDNSILTTPFNLIYGGGGVWTKDWADGYQPTLKIFKSPMLKKCIILPSSFNDCQDAIDTFDERFVVFCREKRSFEYCKSINQKAKFILSDDMAVNADYSIFSKDFYDENNLKNFLNKNKKELKEVTNKIYPLYQKVYNNAVEMLKTNSNSNVGYFLRTDAEKSNNLTDTIATMDLSLLVGGLCCDKGLDFLFSKIFASVINSFDVIVTDRLHIGICATNLGKQVLLLDNSYKKVSSVFENSLKDKKNVKLTGVDTLQQDLDECLKAISQNKKYKNNSFDKVPSNFDEFILQYGSFKNDYGCERRYW